MKRSAVFVHIYLHRVIKWRQYEKYKQKSLCVEGEEENTLV